VELLGLLAGVLTTSAFVPQAVQSWRTRSARDVNLGLLVLMATGNALWFTYGALVGSWGLVAANLCTLPLCLLVLWVKVKWGEAAQAVAARRAEQRLPQRRPARREEAPPRRQRHRPGGGAALIGRRARRGRLRGR
jgi:MtN3 and saliva related transmembrane protein